MIRYRRGFSFLESLIFLWFLGMITAFLISFVISTKAKRNIYEQGYDVEQVAAWCKKHHKFMDEFSKDESIQQQFNQELPSSRPLGSMDPTESHISKSKFCPCCGHSFMKTEF